MIVLMANTKIQVHVTIVTIAVLFVLVQTQLIALGVQLGMCIMNLTVFNALIIVINAPCQLV